MKVNFSIWDVRPWAVLFAMVATGFIYILLNGYCDIASGNPAAAENPAVKLIGMKNVLNYQYWWLGAMGAVLMLDIYCLAKGFHALININGTSNALDGALMMIPVKCFDCDIVEMASRLDISVTAEEVHLQKAVLLKASPEALANILCCLFHLMIEDIQDIARRHQSYTAFHSLADQLLNNWSYHKIMRFLEAVKCRKEYIGKKMEAAFDRRELERRVESLQAEIDSAMEREQTYSLKDVDASIKDCLGLLSGRSALFSWLKRKCRNFGLTRSASG